MFRAQINQMADGPTLKLEGCLVAEWANEAKSLMTEWSCSERPHR